MHFAEWVGVRTLDIWLTVAVSRRCPRSLWTPCWSASFGHSGKSSNLFSSATQCCLVPCSWPDGPLILWWESKNCGWERGKLLRNGDAFSDFEFVGETDRADLLWICGLCSSYESLMSLHTIITVGVIMFFALFDANSAVEFTSCVQLNENTSRRHIEQLYSETPFKQVSLHHMRLLTQCKMCNLETVISAEWEDDKSEAVNICQYSSAHKISAMYSWLIKSCSVLEKHI